MEEKWVGLLFCLMAFLWIFRAPIEIGTMTIPGWSTLLINPGYINDGTIAIAMATLLFLIPGGKKGRLMDWNTAVRLPNRKSTRLNSSHVAISYAVFCLKKEHN